MPDLEKSQTPDSFTQEIPVTLLPVSVKFSTHPAGNSASESESRARTLCKMQPAVPQDSCGNHQKLCSDPVKFSRPQQRFNRLCSYKEVESPPEEEPLQSDRTRCTGASLGSSCSSDLSSRLSSVEDRTNEGPFFSSVTLWGLAMKTLQNESELGQ